MYIVGPDQYRNNYNKGLLKYIPKRFVPRIKPKLLTLIKDKEESIIGKAIGIFLSYEELSADEFIYEIVKGVGKYREEETQKIIFEDTKFLDYHNMRTIEEKTGLKIVNGNKVVMKFLPIVLKDLFLEIGEKSIDFELLLIVNEEKGVKALLKELSKMIRFMTIFAKEYEGLLKIKEEILLETGLSIYCTKDIDKTLGNYYIIINLNNSVSLNVDKLKHKSIIFDFTNNNILDQVKLKNKNCIVINDFLFQNNNLFFHDESIIKLRNEIPSRLYEINEKLNREDFKGLVTDKEKYTIKRIIGT